MLPDDQGPVELLRKHRQRLVYHLLDQMLPLHHDARLHLAGLPQGKAAWFEQPHWQRTPAAIRRTLTATHVEADDGRVLFVGLALYKEAGGGVVRDLFQPEHEGYLTDPALLDRLVAERLEAEAASVRAEGWKWVEIMPRLDYAVLRGFDRVHPERVPLPADQQEELDRLAGEYDLLIKEQGDDPEAEVAAQLDVLSEKIDRLAEGAIQWQPAELALAGTIIGIGQNGRVQIERGLLRAEDRAAHRLVRQNLGGEMDEGNLSSPDTVHDPAAPLSVRLIEDLTAERTAALRAMMQDNETVALAALAHKLTLAVFYPFAYQVDSCLDIRFVSRDLRSSAEQTDDSGAAILLANLQAGWEKRLPEDSANLFRWLLAQESATVTSLVAFCAAVSVDAVRGKQDRRECPRLAHADALDAALGLDMTIWWEPTKERYLGRVPKSLILDAVAEGVSKQAAENLAMLRKDALVASVAGKLAGKGWLPAILRPPAPVSHEAEILLEAAE